jgi:hypothetical protein
MIWRVSCISKQSLPTPALRITRLKLVREPHLFAEAGNREFDSFAWMPLRGSRAGEILLADSTVFSTLFGADDSLKQFWKNPGDRQMSARMVMTVTSTPRAAIHSTPTPTASTARTPGCSSSAGRRGSSQHVC